MLQFIKKNFFKYFQRKSEYFYHAEYLVNFEIKKGQTLKKNYTSTQI